MGKLQVFCEVTLRKLSLRHGNGITESVTSRHIDTYATWPILIITWPRKFNFEIWPQARSRKWPKQVMLHITQCVSSRKTVWHLPHVSISFLSKVMDRKCTLLWHIMTSSGQYTFLPTKFDRKEIETWGRSQFVCLDETHWLVCNMTYLGPFRDLTWGQISKLTFRGHVMIKIGHVAYVSMRLDETDSVTLFPCLKLHFLKVTLQTTCNFPMTSSRDLRWPFEG